MGNVNLPKISLPEDFVDDIKEFLPESEWESFLSSYDEDRSYGLRRNPLKISEEEFEARMPFDLEPVPWCEEGYFYNPLQQPGKHPYHEEGLYYIQEPSAMIVGRLLDPKSGDRICDLCAAPGGKSTHAAGRIGNAGLLVSNEYVGRRAAALCQNLERFGVENCIVLTEDTANVSVRFPLYFDGVIVDAPCSGEGMFRKEEFALTQWSKELVKECALRQKEILDNAASMVKPGGTLVYSTCTFAREENEYMISDFLERHPEFSADEQILSEKDIACGLRPGLIPGTVRMWPHLVRGEGHFAAKLIRKSTVDKNDDSMIENTYDQRAEFGHESREEKKSDGKRGVKSSISPHSKKGKKMQPKSPELSFEEFCAQLLTDDYLERLRRYGDFVWNNSGEILQYVRRELPELSGLKAARTGLLLGTAKKERFEPAHTWAMCLRPEFVKQAVQIPNMDSYLRGEAFSCDPSVKGWTLLHDQGVPVGFGKAAAGIMKNHYPKGLRKA